MGVFHHHGELEQQAVLETAYQGPRTAPSGTRATMLPPRRQQCQRLGGANVAGRRTAARPYGPGDAGSTAEPASRRSNSSSTSAHENRPPPAGVAGLNLAHHSRALS